MISYDLMDMIRKKHWKFKVVFLFESTSICSRRETESEIPSSSDYLVQCGDSYEQGQVGTRFMSVPRAVTMDGISAVMFKIAQTCQSVLNRVKRLHEKTKSVFSH